jgi:hypothetical protein
VPTERPTSAASTRLVGRWTRWICLLLVLPAMACGGPVNDDDFAQSDDDTVDDDDSSVDDDDGAPDDDDGAPDDDDVGPDDDDGATGTDDDGDGVTVEAGDCDDGDPDVYPGRWDPPGDGQDSDCSGTDSTGLGHSHALLFGEDPFDHAGRSVSSAGDLDGDGLDEVLVGAPNHDGSRGAVYLLLGSSLADGGHIDLASADVVLQGDIPGSQAGRWVAGGGDVDGDGLGDILVGGPTRDSARGRAWLVLGADVLAGGALPLADAHASFSGGSEFDRAGDVVAWAGDVDGDGLDDVLVGAYGADPSGEESGSGHLFLASGLTSPGDRALGQADAIFEGEAGGDQAAHALASAGDVDGDGKHDILIGAHGNDEAGTDAGKSYLFLGASITAGGTFPVAAADATFLGEAASDFSGWSVASAGDVDADGLADILVAADRNNQGGVGAGKTCLFFGSTVEAGGSFSLADADVALVGAGVDPYELSGWSVTSAGDVDGDGRSDLLIGTIWDSEAGFHAGKAWLVRGSAVAAGGSFSLADSFAAFVGQNIFGPHPTLMHDQSGESVASAGDVDGDGFDDLIVGAPDAADGAGRAYLVLSAW